MMLKSICCFLFSSFALTIFGQHPNGKVSIELSIPHTSQLPWIKSCTSEKSVYVIIRNNSDSTNYFYEAWNSYGYYSISFEIKDRDSIYEITRPKKWWYRNFCSYYILYPGESLVYPFQLIDTACSKELEERAVFEDGWLGFPVKADTVEIRAIYQLCNLSDSIADDWTIRLSTKRDDHIDFLEEDNAESLPNSTKKQETTPVKNTVIFHEPLYSNWQRVVIHP